jgi:hypothetical protein
MTPITRENWKVAQELSQYCSIKHTTASYLESTIVDGKYLIQSQNRAGQGGKEERILYFGTFYTDDRDCVEKTKNMLNDVWRNALIPSVSTLDTLIKTMPAAAPSSESRQQSPKSGDLHRKLALEGKEKKEVLLEKDVLNKIISGKKYPAKNWPNDIIRFYGSNGIATIHPPASFNLPDMAIWAMHNDKLSSFGVADCLFVHLWLETPKGGAYVPVAFVSDNPEVIEFHKKIATGVPSGQNAHLIRKDALQIHVLGNTLFVGWTTPIPLFPTLQSLPPSCIMFEGYNPLKTGANELGYPSGIKIINEFNGFDAFVTFFHPASKYSGPGTDGIVLRDVITTVYPP